MSFSSTNLKLERLEEQQPEDPGYQLSLQNQPRGCGDMAAPYPDSDLISQWLRRSVKAKLVEASDLGESSQGDGEVQAKRGLDPESAKDFVWAKRARVENIVCSISSSYRDGGLEEGGSGYGRSRRAQERSQLKQQLEKMREQVFQLQEKLCQIYSGVAQEERSNMGAAWSQEPSRVGASTRHPVEGSRHPGTLAEALKEELGAAMTQVVDTVMQVFARQQPPPEEPPCSYPSDQTEALPLVVRKSLPRAPPELVASTFPQPMAVPPYLAAFKDRAAGEAYWESVSLRTKLSSRHLLQPHCALFQLAEPTDRQLPKSQATETHHGQEPALYRPSSQEGLTPGHLKKAKLMFFYTRYPSSGTLKTYFSDVKFNRCITSQLIKWFSNFREFFYIQMEKFSRQALSDGVLSVEMLTVTRDSELARVLNQHYNKANDYEIPSKFLEVSQITLREFFSAISRGCDADPSWKKSIYKVICKLECDIPDAFKSPHGLPDTVHE
ncbi:prospero homeobox protein 1 isoform X1 [Chelonia mydas]|uniref:prospero homeobox protein 1 isoform X1 n=1 Tax=Chelonia mydas TaxID=8469 RepID=UPI001CA802F7|nr:prospero homeobox protein 1 isoform X1 [Chelonia mydas]XP_043406420.1 prospero homeobox protein 1 isoform X1 [Chelonia mydas]XP_043406421.1 prospero homeobox protein 1 isoform X1 [Chelonia mydas]